jgi:DNA-binding SARP family transcriptional activator
LTSLARHLRAEHPGRALALLGLACEHHPDDEPAIEALIELAVTHNQPDTAHRAHTRHTAALAELGLTPNPDLTRLLPPTVTAHPPVAPPASSVSAYPSRQSRAS